MSHRNHCITIVYRCIDFVTWILSIVAWNLLRGYRLSPHRICYVDIVNRHIVIVYCHIVIVYHHVNVVTCSLLHSATFRATVVWSSHMSVNLDVSCTVQCFIQQLEKQVYIVLLLIGGLFSYYHYESRRRILNDIQSDFLSR